MIDHRKRGCPKTFGKMFSDFNRLVLGKGCGGFHKDKNKGQDSPAKDIFHTFE
ncbi:hypothetical protein E27107_550011 [Elizabethkingia anophelis]|nr:hypothetical protein E18064_80019 [Elizabethkingia anophelis]CDN79401.1 hypothetical protein E27107_550011 [Elizabethkingia anophelis]